MSIITVTLAPIVLFTYNRPLHTRQTIEALQKNELAKESKLFIYNDGGSDATASHMVNDIGYENIFYAQKNKNVY